MVGKTDVLFLTEYVSYRHYLRDLLARERQDGGGAALSRLSKAIAMAPSTLSMVISGERGLSNSYALRIARALKFSFEETLFWEALVSFEQAQDEEDRLFHRRRMEDASRRVPVHLVRTSGMELKHAWYLPALLGYLIDLEETPDARVDTASILERLDYAALSRRFECGEEEIRVAAARLFESGLVALRDSSQALQIRMDRLASTHAQKSLIRKTMHEAERRLERDYGRADTFFSADVLTIAQEDFPRLRQEFKELLVRTAVSFNPQTQRRTQVQSCIQMFLLDPISE